MRTVIVTVRISVAFDQYCSLLDPVYRRNILFLVPKKAIFFEGDIFPLKGLGSEMSIYCDFVQCKLNKR